MPIAIDLEDPAQPDIVVLLQHGDDHMAALYRAESNHGLPLEALRAPNVCFFVARGDDGSAVGTGALVLNDGWAEIKRLWVEPAARGRGLARRILAVIEERARLAETTALFLETGIDSKEGLALYRKSGFSVCGPFASYAADPLSVFMRKPL